MSTDLRLITRENFFSNVGHHERVWQDAYVAMYSSLWNGFVTDPGLMLLPIDDHLVHRGDGVFDVMRCVHGKIYQMEAHIQRLERSADAISLELPPDYDRIREIIKTLVLKGKEKDCLIRIILSRGPGGFSTNPFECPASQMYINIIRYHQLSHKVYQEGVAVITSRVPIKKSFFATIKSCNYLPNVLMKMEAINTGCQYAIALDDDGFLAEGSTESIGVLSGDGILKFPGFENTLASITLTRTFQLAGTLVKEKAIKGVQFAKIPLEEAYSSSEIILMGTSINLIPVVSFDGSRIGNGSPGPVYSRLSSLLWEDMTENENLLTEIEWETEG